MAMQPIYDGPVLVRIDANQSAGLESLGYTEDGAEWNRDVSELRVNGDENGGADGDPIDVQHLGGLIYVRLTLTKYDTAVLDKLEPFIPGTTLGTAATPGTLEFTESNKVYRLLLSPTNRPKNFPRARLKSWSWTKGVKHSKPVLLFECHKNGSGVYYNTTTA